MNREKVKKKKKFARPIIGTIAILGTSILLFSIGFASFVISENSEGTITGGLSVELGELTTLFSFKDESYTGFESTKDGFAVDGKIEDSATLSLNLEVNYDDVSEIDGLNLIVSLQFLNDNEITLSDFLTSLYVNNEQIKSCNTLNNIISFNYNFNIGDFATNQDFIVKYTFNSGLITYFGENSFSLLFTIKEDGND